MTEFEEWRVEMACKKIHAEEQYLGRPLGDAARCRLLVASTYWTDAQIEDAVMAIRLNGGSVSC